MKSDILEKIEIPKEVEIEINGGVVVVRTGDIENKKKFDLTDISLTKQGEEFILESKNAGKKQKKRLYTIKAHMINMIKGVQKNFCYKLEIAYVHFPFTVEIDKEKKKIIVKNFLGEKKQRNCEILDNSEVSIQGHIITVESHNKEIAGQMAANLEKTTKVRKKDKRKFQDGIYIIEKCGRAI